MDKPALKAAIDAAGGMKNQRAQAWEDAFKAYNSQPGVTIKLKRGCGNCYRTLYAWLSA